MDRWNASWRCPAHVFPSILLAHGHVARLPCGNTGSVQILRKPSACHPTRKPDDQSKFPNKAPSPRRARTCRLDESGSNRSLQSVPCALARAQSKPSPLALGAATAGGIAARFPAVNEIFGILGAGGMGAVYKGGKEASVACAGRRRAFQKLPGFAPHVASSPLDYRMGDTEDGRAIRISPAWKRLAKKLLLYSWGMIF